MKCPHCLESFHSGPKWFPLPLNDEFTWGVVSEICPACSRIIISLRRTEWRGAAGYANDFLVWPRAMSRVPLPKEVPDEFARDYQEASMVLA
jgi:hypothetical protein